MKLYKIYLVIIVSCSYGLLLTFLSCEKKLFDYRNKFCGEYAFSAESILSVDSETTITYSEYDGEVYYDKKAEDDLITIHYKEEAWKTFKVSKDGVFSVSAEGPYSV